MTGPTRDEPSRAWLDVVAAVDHLASGRRPGITVWCALAEAIDGWTTARLGEALVTRRRDTPWDDPDPLRSAVDRLLGASGGPGTIDGCSLAAVLEAALDWWLLAMADLHNDGRRFAHPTPRGGWPAVVAIDADALLAPSLSVRTRAGSAT